MNIKITQYISLQPRVNTVNVVTLFLPIFFLCIFTYIYIFLCIIFALHYINLLIRTFSHRIFATDKLRNPVHVSQISILYGRKKPCKLNDNGKKDIACLSLLLNHNTNKIKLIISTM